MYDLNLWSISENEITKSGPQYAAYYIILYILIFYIFTSNRPVSIARKITALYFIKMLLSWPV